MFVPLLLTVLSHSQQGKLECSKPVHIGTAEISVSYWIEDANCTFVIDANQVDAISISRSMWPLQHVGSIEVNNIVSYENTSVTGHIEPFAILPMWSTYSKTDITLDNQQVHVHLQGKAFVSFGMAEDPRLLLYEVVQDAYRSREWVYGASPDTIMQCHFMFLAIVLLSSMFGHSAVKLALSSWIAGSVFADYSVWAILASYLTSSAGGTFHIVVSILRLSLLFYLLYITIETPSKPAGKWTVCGATSRIPVAMFLLLYLFWVFYGGRASMSDAVVVYSTVPALVAIVALAMPYVGLLLMHTLLGIVLNLGAGLLAPTCLVHAYFKRKHHFNSSKLRLLH